MIIKNLCICKPSVMVTFELDFKVVGYHYMGGNGGSLSSEIFFSRELSEASE